MKPLKKIPQKLAIDSTKFSMLYAKSINNWQHIGYLCVKCGIKFVRTKMMNKHICKNKIAKWE